MSGILSKVVDGTVRAHSLAMRPSGVVIVAPSGILTDQHTNPLSKLTEPSDSSDIGTDRHTRPIASLIPILPVRTLSHT